MTELNFLGTGGSVATEERDNTSFLLKHDNRFILVDCPGSVVQKIRRVGCIPSSVSSILITHVHPDHVYGLPSFVHSLMLEATSVRVYGSEEAVGFCRRLLDLFRLFDKQIRIRVEFHPLKPAQKVELADSLQVSVLRVPHSSSSLAYHFYFTESGKELLYSGDTAADSSLFKEAEKIDFLIHDCSAPSRFFHKYPALRDMHTDSLELGKRAQHAKVRSLIPCHFFGEVEFSLSEIEEEIRKNYTGNLVVPRDFQKILL